VVKGREKGEREKGGLRDEGARMLDEPFSSFPPIHPSIDNAIRYRRVHRTRRVAEIRAAVSGPAYELCLSSSTPFGIPSPIWRRNQYFETRKIEYRYRSIDDSVDQLIMMSRMMSASLQSSRVININCVFLPFMYIAFIVIHIIVYLFLYVYIYLFYYKM